MAQHPRPEDDLDRWLDQLAGRQTADPAMQTVRDALRRIGPDMMERRLGEAGTVQAEQQALQRLMARLDREMVWPLPAENEAPLPATAAAGVGDPSGNVIGTPVDSGLRNGGGLGGPPGPRRWPWAASAGLALALAAWLTLRPTPPGAGSGWPVQTAAPPVYRGDAAGFRQASAQPLADAQALARQLSPWAQGPVLYWHDGQATLDFELAPEAVEAAQAGVSGPVARALKPGLNRLVIHTAR